jgi:hypothetical protein
MMTADQLTLSMRMRARLFDGNPAVDEQRELDIMRREIDRQRRKVQPT